jgi:hypothetical protein
MQLRLRQLPWIALALGFALLAGLAAWTLTHNERSARLTPPPATATVRTTTVPTTTAPITTAATTTAPTTIPPPSPATTAPVATVPVTTVPTTTAPVPVTFSWNEAGGIVLHPAAVDPAWLGRVMRAAGFGWVALFLGDGPALAAPDASWIARFQAASGMAVGGWSVLRDDPVGEAQTAAQLVGQSGLSFYIADAEAEYAYTDGADRSGERYDRSQQFVSTFRALEPALPAAVSSYCRPDQHDLDWAAWSHAGFAFLPQAYVNDFGTLAAPVACANGAAAFFPRRDVHPTIGSYPGVLGMVAPAQIATDLQSAGTIGFSIFPAEVGLADQDWQAYGTAIATLGIAAPAG